MINPIRKNFNKSLRFKSQDYSEPGSYFVTICTENKRKHFGNIIESEKEMYLSEVGEIAKKYWQEIPEHFQDISLGQFVVMPDHIHGIINITRSDVRSNINKSHTTNTASQNYNFHSTISDKKRTLGLIIRQYKSSLKRWCNDNNHREFTWQINYYERIIQSDKEYNSVTNYISNNVLKWCEEQIVMNYKN